METNNLDKLEAGNQLFELGKMLMAKEQKPDKITVNELTKKLREGQLAKFALSSVQLRMVAFAWHDLIAEQDISQRYGDLVRGSRTSPSKALQHMETVLTLLEKNVFDVDERRLQLEYLRAGGATKLDISLFRASFRLHDDFITLLLTGSEENPEAERPFESLEEYTEFWNAHIERKDEVIEDEMPYRTQRGKRLPFNFPDKTFFATLERREEVSKEEAKSNGTEHSQSVLSTFPIRELAKQYELDEKEQLIIMYALHEEVQSSSYSVGELVRFVSDSKSDCRKNLKYFGPESRLLRNQLFVEKSESFVGGKNYVLAYEVRDLLEGEGAKVATLEALLTGRSMFDVIDPMIEESQIVLAPEVQHNLFAAVERMSSGVQETLAEWGLSTKQDQRKSLKATPKLIILLHGEPGTGKTLASRVLARKLGKQIVTTDVSRILDCWFGESQKNMKRLFQIYRKLVSRLENPPLLLLNECDQLLGRRFQETQHSTDSTQNQLQNILLEEMETFEGVMVLTTNFVGSLDKAFSRRFDLKLEILRPTAEERVRIWQIHLPNTVPGVADIDIHALGREFDVTGGQIAVIVSNAVSEAATRAGTERRLNPDDLRKYAKLELATAFEKRKCNPVGFHRK